MPVLFTLDLPTDDKVEAKRLAILIRKLPCDVHDEVPTRVRLSSRIPDAWSVFVRGCCPQLYIVVTERLVREAIPSNRSTQTRQDDPRLPVGTLALDD